jgi:hypothetical protein
MPYVIERNGGRLKFDANSTRIRQMKWYFEKHGNGNVQFPSVNEMALVSRRWWDVARVRRHKT